VAAPLPVPAVLNNPAAAAGGNKATAAGSYGGAAAALSNQPQLEEWDAETISMMEHCNANCGGDEGLQLPPYACCRRPLKTLDLFPTKSTGLRDECSSSKSSSCSTSTN